MFRCEGDIRVLDHVTATHLFRIAQEALNNAVKHGKAKRVICVLLDSAIDQYAIETNKLGGMNPAFGDLKVHIKKGGVLYNTGKDIFGNDYGPFTVDSLPKVPSNSRTSLSDVCNTTFWSPYP